MGTAYSVSHSQCATWFRTDGLDSDPVVKRLITCHPIEGHKTNGIRLANLISGLVFLMRSGGSAGSLLVVIVEGRWGATRNSILRTFNSAVLLQPHNYVVPIFCRYVVPLFSPYAVQQFTIYVINHFGMQVKRRCN